MSKKEGKALKSLKSSGRRGESVQENRTYVERLVRRIVEHVSYREAVRSEPKIIECLELYQQDLWEGEHCKREASQAEKKVAGASTSARARLRAALPLGDAFGSSAAGRIAPIVGQEVCYIF